MSGTASPDRTGADRVGEPWPPLPEHRAAGIALLALLLVAFATGAVVRLSGDESTERSPLFLTAVALVVGAFVALPVLLLGVTRRRRLARLERRLVMMRALWGGPFGALGALWDLTGERRPKLL